MKKFIFSLLFFLSLLALPTFSFAVDEDCAVQPITGYDSLTYYVFEGQILLECTAASDDASMAFTFGAKNSATGQFMGLMDNRHVVAALTYDGAGVDPTAAVVDLDIVDSDGAVFVSAANNGANVVVAGGATAEFYFEDPDGNNGYPEAAGAKPWTMTWTGNLVNSAVNYLRLTVTGPRFVK